MSDKRGHGEGSIRKQGNRWQASIMIHGERKWKSFGTKTEATQWIAEIRAEGKKDVPYAMGITLGDYASAWYDRVKDTVSRGTSKTYGVRVERLKTFPISKVTMGAITKTMIEEQSPEWGTIDQRRKLIELLRTIFNDAIEAGHIEQSPARKAKLPKSLPRQVDSYTIQEVRNIIRTTKDDWMHAYWVLAIDSGMRPGELLGLHWDAIDLESRTISIRQSLEEVEGRKILKTPKTTAGLRTIFIGKTTAEVLRAHKRKVIGHFGKVPDAVFVGEKSGDYHSQWSLSARHMPLMAKRAKVRCLRPYDLRHTCATLLLSQGVSIKIVSERLGHKDITTTLKYYVHCLPTAQAAAAQAFDEMIG